MKIEIYFAGAPLARKDRLFAPDSTEEDVSLAAKLPESAEAAA